MSSIGTFQYMILQFIIYRLGKFICITLSTGQSAMAVRLSIFCEVRKLTRPIGPMAGRRKWCDSQQTIDLLQAWGDEDSAASEFDSVTSIATSRRLGHRWFEHVKRTQIFFSIDQTSANASFELEILSEIQRTAWQSKHHSNLSRSRWRRPWPYCHAGLSSGLQETSRNPRAQWPPVSKRCSQLRQNSIGDSMSRTTKLSLALTADIICWSTLIYLIFF